MNLGLEGRRVVVTGAGSGIGRATAQAFAREGALVTALGRTRATLEATVASLEPVPAGAHRAEVCDLADESSVESFAARLLENPGGCDVLVNNACSHAALKKLHDIPPAHWDTFVSANLGGVFRLCRLLVPGMVERRWGRVVNVGSLTSELGSSHYAEYAAVKAALIGLTRNMAVDYGRHGVLVNAVQPGFVATERFEAAAPPKLREAFVQATSVKRIGSPGEIADVIVFLASERASYVTGAVLPVGGGAGLNNLW